MGEDPGMVSDSGHTKDEGCGSSTPLGCNVRKPRGLPGKDWVDRISDRDEAPPTSERNIWRANVRMRRSHTSVTGLIRAPPYWEICCLPLRR